jgi:hypothetical protein
LIELFLDRYVGRVIKLSVEGGWETFRKNIALSSPCNVVDIAPSIGVDEVCINGQVERIPYALERLSHKQ